MSESQIIYPAYRLLANPRIFKAIANFFGEGPDWETFASAFYDLMESDFIENHEIEPEFEEIEVCFRIKPEDEEVFQIILANGMAIELKPDDQKHYAFVSSEDERSVVSSIYKRLVKAIEEERPDLKGNIVLSDPPTPANGFLRSENGENFAGEFHLLDDPNVMFNFVVDILDLNQDQLKATVRPK